MKKGFTLIELLAVIVILAIIALIATPIVINIIEDSKKSATLRSADFYLDGVEYAISKRVLDGNRVSDGTYNIIEGDICLDYEEKCKDILKVEVKGEKPTSGNITLEDGQIKDIYLTYTDKNIIFNTIGTAISAMIASITITASSSIKVNPFFIFYFSYSMLIIHLF